MRVEHIAAVLRDKKRIHPELRRPLSWEGFKRILARENVALFVTPVPKRDAQLVYFAGGWAILVNSTSSVRRHTYFGVHELGHLWLHHDPGCDRHERVYNMGYPQGLDPREEDAELFAVMVLGNVRYF